MTVFIALLRAVNVGGTGKLPMAELRALAEKEGFTEATTYIQSGNLVFRSELTPVDVQTRLETALTGYFGKPQTVLLRTLGELEDLCARDLFPDAAPNRILITFLSEPVPPRALEEMVAPDGEQAEILGREIAVHYPNGQGRSKLKLPALKAGTARNLNTVRKLLEMAQELSG